MAPETASGLAGLKRGRHVRLAGDVRERGQAAAQLRVVLQTHHGAGGLAVGQQRLRQVPLGVDALAVVVAADAVPEVVAVGAGQAVLLPALQPLLDLRVLQVAALDGAVFLDLLREEHRARAVQDGHLLLDEGRE